MNEKKLNILIGKFNKQVERFMFNNQFSDELMKKILLLKCDTLLLVQFNIDVIQPFKQRHNLKTKDINIIMSNYRKLWSSSVQAIETGADIQMKKDLKELKEKGD